MSQGAEGQFSGPLNELWAGQIFGTNTGKIFLDIRQNGDRLSGTLRLADDQMGLVILSVVAEFEGGLLSVKGEPIQTSEGVELGKVTANARLQPDGSLTGEWVSEAGTAGTLVLFPHVGSRAANVPSGPEQLYTTTRELGALRLYRDDVLEVIGVLRRKFPQARVVVTHIDRGAELARFSEEFERSIDRIDRLTWLKLSAQAPAEGGLNKSVTIDLGQSFNRVTVQGPDEAWVLGEAEATSSFLKRREKRLSTALGKYRVNLNQLVFLGAVVAMPDLPLPTRAAFILSVLVLLFLATKVQDSLIPNLVVDFSRPRASWAAQVWPSILSWMISMTAGVAASIVYGLLTRG